MFFELGSTAWPVNVRDWIAGQVNMFEKHQTMDDAVQMTRSWRGLCEIEDVGRLIGIALNM